MSTFSGAGKKLSIAEYARQLSDKRQKLIQLAQTNFAMAQENQKNYHDRKRNNMIYKAGYRVMLDARHLDPRNHKMGHETTKTKLLAKKIELFKMKEMISKEWLNLHHHKTSAS